MTDKTLLDLMYEELINLDEQAGCFDEETNAKIDKQRSKVYNLINKYASKYGLKNLTGNFAEPWHWSYNGG